MGKILIIGYSGNVGGSVARHLNKFDVDYIIGVRSPSKIKNTRNNVEVRHLDLEDKTTFPNALKDVSSIFLVRPPQLTDISGIFRPLIDYCKNINLEHIVFLSLLGVEKNPFPPHHKIEKLIEASEINYTFIRPSFFMQNLIDPHASDIRERNEIFIPSGKAKISFIDTEDIGEIIAKVLTEKGHYNNKYTITGSEAVDYYTVARIMGQILNRKITYVNPSLLKFRTEIIRSGVKKEFANVMTVLYLTTKLGMAKNITTVAEDILGRKPHTIKDFIKRNKAVW